MKKLLDKYRFENRSRCMLESENTKGPQAKCAKVDKRVAIATEKAMVGVATSIVHFTLRWTKKESSKIRP